MSTSGRFWTRSWLNPQMPASDRRMNSRIDGIGLRIDQVAKFIGVRLEQDGRRSSQERWARDELGVQPVSPSSSKDENAATSVKIPQAVAPAATVPALEPDPQLPRARQSKQ